MCRSPHHAGKRADTTLSTRHKAKVQRNTQGLNSISIVRKGVGSEVFTSVSNRVSIHDPEVSTMT